MLVPKFDLDEDEDKEEMEDESADIPLVQPEGDYTCKTLPTFVDASQWTSDTQELGKKLKPKSDIQSRNNTQDFGHL